MKDADAEIHKDLRRVGEGYYRLGVCHLERVDRPQEPCDRCSGTGRDPANRRRTCAVCHGKKQVDASKNAAAREGYRIGRELVGARDLASAVRDLEARGIDYTREPTRVLYFN